MQSRWIWPFELQEKIGEGGMGVVYRARYVENDRQVAVKMLADDIDDKKLLNRFERELEILKTLKHPNIVHCFGGVCEDNRRFYAMELVEGGTLDELLKQRGQLSWQETIDYSLQICSALAFAHETGVVHRDIKPGNFLLTKSGKLKLSDFGLATIQAARKITAAGMTVGSFHYMAPEQIRGRGVTPQTDLYALGCVMFEMLTGNPPFVGESAAEILHQHTQKKPPRVSSLVKGCPGSLDSLVDSLLQKDTLQRPPNATAVSTWLNDVTATSTFDDGFSEHQLGRATESSESGVMPGVAHGTIATIVQSGWPLAVCLVLISVLLYWNVSLSSENNRIHQDVTTAVVAGLTDQDARVRISSATALGKMGAAARGALPKLRRAQKSDPNPRVRITAGQAVENIRRAAQWRSSGHYGVSLIVAIIVGSGFYLAKKSGLLEYLRPDW